MRLVDYSAAEDAAAAARDAAAAAGGGANASSGPASSSFADLLLASAAAERDAAAAEAGASSSSSSAAQSLPQHTLPGMARAARQRATGATETGPYFLPPIDWYRRWLHRATRRCRRGDTHNSNAQPVVLVCSNDEAAAKAALAEFSPVLPRDCLRAAGVDPGVIPVR